MLWIEIGTIHANCAHYDYFQDIDGLYGDCEYIMSKGATSPEFVLNTFSGETYNDTILITSNPHYEKLDGQVFFAVERNYRGDTIEEYYKLLNDDINTTRRMHKKYPDKRLITHMTHPHALYISAKVKKFRKELPQKVIIASFQRLTLGKLMRLNVITNSRYYWPLVLGGWLITRS